MTWSKRGSRTRCLIYLLIIGTVGTAAAAEPGPVDPEMAAIEKLHAQDVAATLAGDPKALAALWTDDAVRLEPGGDAEIGRANIRAEDEKEKIERPEARMVAYAPEIKEVKIVGEWAFEWGYFTGSYQTSAKDPPQNFRAKLLRVLHKQSDGTWKFARVMWNVAK